MALSTHILKELRCHLLILIFLSPFVIYLLLYLVRDIKPPNNQSCFLQLFQLLKLRKIRGKNLGKQDWWFDVTNKTLNHVLEEFDKIAIR